MEVLKELKITIEMLRNTEPIPMDYIEIEPCNVSKYSNVFDLPFYHLFWYLHNIPNTKWTKSKSFEIVKIIAKYIVKSYREDSKKHLSFEDWLTIRSSCVDPENVKELDVMHIAATNSSYFAGTFGVLAEKQIREDIKRLYWE